MKNNKTIWIQGKPIWKIPVDYGFWSKLWKRKSFIFLYMNYKWIDFLCCFYLCIKKEFTVSSSNLFISWCILYPFTLTNTPYTIIHHLQSIAYTKKTISDQIIGFVFIFNLTFIFSNSRENVPCCSIEYMQIFLLASKNVLSPVLFSNQLFFFFIRRLL